MIITPSNDTTKAISRLDSGIGITQTEIQRLKDIYKVMATDRLKSVLSLLERRDRLEKQQLKEQQLVGLQADSTILPRSSVMHRPLGR